MLGFVNIYPIKVPGKVVKIQLHSTFRQVFSIRIVKTRSVMEKLYAINDRSKRFTPLTPNFTNLQDESQCIH